MAITVYPKGDFIVFEDVGGVQIETAQYSQIRWVRTIDGFIAFENIADEFRVIATAPVGEILDELGAVWGATIDLFNAAFTAALPQTGGGGGGGGGATEATLLIVQANTAAALPLLTAIESDTDATRIASQALQTRLSDKYTVSQTLRSVAGIYTSTANIKRLTLIAGAGSSFSVGSIVYPFLTANGVIDSFIVGNGINPLDNINYTLIAGTVLQIQEA